MTSNLIRGASAGVAVAAVLAFTVPVASAQTYHGRSVYT